MNKKWIKIIGIVGLCFVIFGLASFAVFINVLSPQIMTAILTQLIVGAVGLAIYLIYFFGDFMRGLRQNKDRLTGILGIALFFLIVIGINIVAHTQLSHLEFDSTREKLFSLHPQTREILDQLETDVWITSFVTDPQGKQVVERLMQRYLRVSPRIRFESLDPDRHPQKVLDLGASETQVVLVNAETEKREVLDFRGLTEQEVSNAIRRLQLQDNYKVYFLSGPGFAELHLNTNFGREANPSDLNYAPFFLNREGFQLGTLNLIEDPRIPSDARAVVAWSIGGGLPESSLQILEDYLDRGGNVVIAQSPYQNRTTGQLEFGSWNPLLKKYNTAFDEKLSLIAVPDRPGQIRVSLSTIVRVSGEEFSRGIDPRQDFGEFALSQAVEMIDESDPPEVFRTNFLVNIATVAKTREIERVRPGASLPESDFELLDEAVYGSKIVYTHPEERDFGQESRLVILGNSQFATNKYYTVPFHNNLFLNIFHSLLETEQPISIRPKTWPRSTLEISAEAKMAVIFASIFLIPELIIVFGLAFWVLRRSPS